jgi:TPR repeat protein
MHYLGAYKLKRDPVRAWVWYSLAAQKGDALATEQLSKVTAELTPEQLEEAKRQLEAWQPGQCIKGLVPDQKTQ